MAERATIRTRDIWNVLSHQVAVEGANLSASLFFAYRDAWERFETATEFYLSDRRRDWTDLALEPTDTPEASVLTFGSPRRANVSFIIERSLEVADVIGFWAYTTTSGQLRKATIESFIDSARGYWFPRLSYRFMDDLSPLLNEALSNTDVELTEFVVNVFERVRRNRLIKQKTTRTWVETEGEREYDLYRRFNAEAGRIVTLNGARYNLSVSGRPGKMDIRVDHRARVLLATPHFQELKKVQRLLADEASKEFRNYNLRKQMRSGTVRSDTGEERTFVEYVGTDLLVIDVLGTSDEWFDNLKSVIYDAVGVMRRERIVPFVLVDEGNPLLQTQLVDLEGQDVYTVTIQKDDRKIIIAPEAQRSHVESVGKIVNFLQKTIGASSLSI